MWRYFSRLRMAALNTGVVTTSSLAQIRVQDTKEQRQHRRNNVRLTKSGNARSEQLLMIPTKQLIDWELVSRRFLSGLECSKAQLVFRYEISDLFATQIVSFLDPTNPRMDRFQYCSQTLPTPAWIAFTIDTESDPCWVGRVWERDYTQNENGTIAMVLDASDIYLFIVMILDPLPFLTKRPVYWENG